MWRGKGPVALHGSGWCFSNKVFLTLVSSLEDSLDSSQEVPEETAPALSFACVLAS